MLMPKAMNRPWPGLDELGERWVDGQRKRAKQEGRGALLRIYSRGGSVHVVKRHTTRCYD